MKINWVYNIPHPALDTHCWILKAEYVEGWTDYYCEQCGLIAMNDGSDRFFLHPREHDEALYYTCDELIIAKVLL